MNDIRIFPSVPIFELSFSSAEPLYSQILALQGREDTCPVVTQEIGSEFHLDVPAIWNRDIFM